RDSGCYERLHQQHHALVAEKDYPDWILHYRDRSASGSGCARTEPEQQDDLRFEKLFVLLSPDARQEDAVRRTSSIFPRESEYGAGERSDFAGRNDRSISAIERHKSGVCLGRYARFCVRHHATRRKDG